LKQHPAPGEELLFYRGDSVTFTLEISGTGRGHAWLRTNLGMVEVRRRELVRHTEAGMPVLARDWHDLPMRMVAPGRFTLSLPLLEPGIFEAKAFFMADGDPVLHWPAGGNTSIKVSPAYTCNACTMYTVFPRQFGANRQARSRDAAETAAVARLEERGYAVIPPSGTFRDVIRELDFIIGTLRSRIIQLLPIHPTPAVYARMGRFGSPFAALDFFDVDPAYAEFDVKATPMDQFLELADAVHGRGARLFIDIPVNHTGWGSREQHQHPEHFVRQPDGTFVSPGAWGVTWADLCKLDYNNPGVHHLMAEVFLFWCRQGVDGFRCDAGYMLPLHAWEYITAKVREEFPDTVFMLEGLGGPIVTMEQLLTRGNLDWAYSELFQNYDRGQISWYLPYVFHSALARGVLIHFAETHDNGRLAARSPAWARLRTGLCALASHNGAFGITNGVEWLATAKVDVHEAAPLNWGAPENLVNWIRRLQTLLTIHESFAAGTHLELLEGGGGNALALLRSRPDSGNRLLVLANLEDARDSEIFWAAARFPLPAGGWIDLLSGETVSAPETGGLFKLRLAPGRVFCLSSDRHDLVRLEAAVATAACDNERAIRQELLALALDVWQARHGFADLLSIDPEAMAEELRRDPLGFIASVFGTVLPPVTRWRAGQDEHRQVMVPPGHFLLVEATHPFTVRLSAGNTVRRHQNSLRQAGGSWFALLAPLASDPKPVDLALAVALHEEGKTRHLHGTVLALPSGAEARAQGTATAMETRHGHLYALCSTRLGGMAQVRGAWAELRSKYDSLLAANVHRHWPVDRRVMFTRCRLWLIYRDFSQAVDLACLEQFRAGAANQAEWHFAQPCGQGKTVRLTLVLTMALEDDAIQLAVHRQPAPGGHGTCLADAEAVRIILRPDIEDRNCHETTKAYLGPEHHFPTAVRPLGQGFSFNPSGERDLHLRLTPGRFVPQPEWHYMVPLPEDAERNLDAATDLFSPGYFEVTLKGGETALLAAAVNPPAKWPTPLPEQKLPDSLPLTVALRQALARFLVRRDDTMTVIAGYPWFLDWGRDSLICLRGVVAAGFHAEARDVLLQFAKFEEGGTLPNMIRGSDHSNRDTSDAPLWFFVALGDYLEATGDAGILKADCGGRTLLAVLKSIARGYRRGIANGIRMDEETGLIFSPPHFTWMDTNHPAATPRQGYPVEIQALWHAALRLLARLDPKSGWGELANRVQVAVMELFVRPGQEHLSDCLHAAPGIPARQAVPDDACRPNQLLAITLGIVDNPRTAIAILSACERLLVPGGVRSLADAPLHYPLPVHHQGRLLNDPHHPYWGHYSGDEDTCRKPAYHNGTVWTWLFPSYAEALVKVGGQPAAITATALLASSARLMDAGCLGQLPEILDGDAPHHQRGCGAQAWGVSEACRVLMWLEKMRDHDPAMEVNHEKKHEEKRQ
jgi:glycogen debranching enzyme